VNHDWVSNNVTLCSVIVLTHSIMSKITDLNCWFDSNSHLVWIHVSLTFGITLRQISHRYRRSARQKKIIYTNIIETPVQNDSVPRNASLNSRWVCLTIFTKFVLAASSERPPPPSVKARRLSDYIKLSVSLRELLQIVYMYVYIVFKYITLGNSD